MTAQPTFEEQTPPLHSATAPGPGFAPEQAAPKPQRPAPLPAGQRLRSFARRHSERIKYAVKMGIVAVLGYWVGAFSGLSNGFLVALYAVVGMQLNVADSVESCINRLIGTLIGAGMAYLAIILFPHSTLAITLQLFGLLAICGLMIHYQERYRMVAITVCILLVTGAMSGDNSLRVCLERVAEIMLGVACSFVVSAFIWPRRLAEDVRTSVRAAHADCLQHYRKIIDCFISGEPVPAQVSQAVYITLPGKIWKDKEKLNKTLRNEAPVFQADYTLVDKLLMSQDRTVEGLKGVLDAMAGMTAGELDPALRESVLSLALATEKALDYLARWPTPEAPPDLRSALHKSVEEIRAARAARRYRHMNAEELERHMAVTNDLRGIARNLMQTMDWLAAYAPGHKAGASLSAPPLA